MVSIVSYCFFYSLKILAILTSSNKSPDCFSHLASNCFQRICC
nr:MAG TPA: hypothetical protein [Caudoviricetes sp.]